MCKNVKSKTTGKNISSETVADIVDCTSRQVRKVWKNPPTEGEGTDLQKMIIRVTNELQTGTTKLIEEVKKIVKL